MLYNTKHGIIKHLSIPIITQEQYIEQLYNYSLPELIKHMKDRHFIYLFHSNIRKVIDCIYVDISSEIFYDYIMSKPNSFIKQVLNFLKNPPQSYNEYGDLFMKTYSEIADNLEKILQYKILNEKLDDSQQQQTIIKKI